MKKKIIFIILVILVVIITITILNTSNGVFKWELEKRAKNIFGSDYCTENHQIEVGGDALTEWKCTLCGKANINPDTNAPEICTNCSRITKRCMYCGKFENKF